MDVSKGLSSVIWTLVAIFAFFREGLAITCYMCNSALTRNGLLCSNMTGNTRLFEQDCDELPEARSGKMNFTVCRKITQKIYDPEGNEEIRIIRQCGTKSPLQCTRKTRTNTLQVLTCHCPKSLCNSANPQWGRPASSLISSYFPFLLALACARWPFV